MVRIDFKEVKFINKIMVVPYMCVQNQCLISDIGSIFIDMKCIFI